MSEPVVIENRPLLARLLLMFWVAEIGVGLLFALAGARLLGPSENGGAVILILMGLVLVAAGVLMTGLCWRVARIRGAAIEMTAEGLLDRRLAERLIPWEALSWKVIFNGRSYSLQLTVANTLRHKVGILWYQRALGLFSRLFRHPEFTVTTLGTGLSAHELASHMERFKPALP
jgi:hypothetical protein